MSKGHARSQNSREVTRHKYVSTSVSYKKYVSTSYSKYMLYVKFKTAILPFDTVGPCNGCCRVSLKSLVAVRCTTCSTQYVMLCECDGTYKYIVVRSTDTLGGGCTYT